MSEAVGGPGLPEEQEGRGWGPVLARLAVGLVILAAIYAGVAYYFKDRPPAGVTVAGVDIGSLTESEARETLSERFGERTTEPLTVEVRPEDAESAETEQLTLVPEEAGLGLDLDETLDGVSGLSFNPARLWAHVAGSERDLPLVGSVDREALEAELTRLAEDYDTEPVEGEVSLGDEGVEVVDARDGHTLAVGPSADAVAEAWQDQVWDESEEDPRGAERTVAGVAETTAPQLTAQEIERFTDEELDPALADPVIVKAARGKGDNKESAEAELGRRDLLDLLAISSDAGTLSLTLDGEATVSRVRQDLGQLERGPRDATVELSGGDIQVIPARVGYALAEDGLAESVDQALRASGDDRTVTVEVETVEPEIPTSASEDWEFSEMATFTSTFPTGASNEARTANLHAGVANVNGTVVMPGEQFSLAAALGDVSLEGGYAEAPIIVDGRLVMGVGGGLSQISTVVFNTSWFSGVQLDAHSPHSFYISRYPAGREATIAIPVLDNLWTNDTDTPVVVRTWITGDQLHMTYVGDRQYTVETIDGARRAVTTGETRYDDREDCVPQSPAEGFTISNTRILLRGGSEVGRDEYTTVYQPADEIICTGR